MATAEKVYEAAVMKRESHDLDSAFLLLEEALDMGLNKPMDIIHDSVWHYLVDDPKWRPKMRDLLKRYAEESEANMARKDEPGLPIQVEITIVEEDTNIPVSNALIELVQADEDGLYFNEQSEFNPRIFAYLITNEKGECKISTVYPGRYRDDANEEVPSHIHFQVEATGYRMYASEFAFADDSVFQMSNNPEGVPVAQFHGNESDRTYRVRIELQPTEN